MRDSDAPDGASIDGVAVLDAGPLPIALREYARAVRVIAGGEVGAVAQDRNATCYRMSLPAADRSTIAAIVKAPRPGPQRTNADATFAGEAAVLARLPALGFAHAPRMLARVAAADRHFLFTTELPGRHPDPSRHPLDATQLAALLATAFELDRRSVMHYDLKAANVLVDGARATFIDFEFARENDHRGAFARGRTAYCTDFNVLANPHFPAKSNAANLEFRALHRYLVGLGMLDSRAAAALFRDYLATAGSAHHGQWADYLETLAATETDAMAKAAALAPASVRKRLVAAAAYERTMQWLLVEPPESIVRAERALIAFRCHTFERRADAARAAAREARAAAADAARAEVVVGYAQSVRRALDLVARSVHPPDPVGDAQRAG